MTSNNNERPSGSYALLKVRDRQNRLNVMQAVANIEQVIASSAVDGDYDIVLLIRELPGASIDQFVTNTIRNLDGIQDVEICHVELTVDGDSETESGNGNQTEKPAKPRAESYLFLETDHRHFEDIFSTLSVLSAVTSCEVASGQFSLVLRLEADNFDSVDKIINDKIRPLPGVLRAKESRIINLAGF